MVSAFDLACWIVTEFENQISNSNLSLVSLCTATDSPQVTEGGRLCFAFDNRVQDHVIFPDSFLIDWLMDCLQRLNDKVWRFQIAEPTALRFIGRTNKYLEKITLETPMETHYILFMRCTFKFKFRSPISEIKQHFIATKEFPGWWVFINILQVVCFLSIYKLKMV